MNITTNRNVELSELSGNTLLKLIFTVSNFFVGGVLLWVGYNTHVLANKPPVPYGITDTGAQLLMSKETKEQQALRIKNFASKTMVGMYTWSSVVDAKSPTGKSDVLDRGINVPDETGRQVPIPTTSFISSLGLESNFGKAYRTQIANYISKYQVGPGNNQSQAFFKVDQISEPIDRGNGNWAVTLVGAQTIRGRGKETVVNHAYTISLRTTETTQLSDVMKRMKDREIAEYSVAIDAYQLKITNITPLS